MKSINQLINESNKHSEEWSVIDGDRAYSRDYGTNPKQTFYAPNKEILRIGIYDYQLAYFSDNNENIPSQLGKKVGDTFTDKNNGFVFIRIN